MFVLLPVVVVALVLESEVDHAIVLKKMAMLLVTVDHMAPPIKLAMLLVMDDHMVPLGRLAVR